MISRIYIDNYRCFTNFELRPGRVNLIIGSNGAGKSSLSEVLNGIVGLSVSGDTVEDAFPTNTLTRWDSRSAQLIEIELEFDGQTFFYSVELDHDRNRETVALQRQLVKHGVQTLFLYERGTVHLHNNEGIAKTRFPFRGNRSFLPQLEPRPENTLLTSVLDNLRRVWTLKLDPTEVEAESRTESDALLSDGSNFASWYRHVSQENPKELPSLFQKLSDALPGFQVLRTASTGRTGRKRELVASFRHDNDPKEYEVFFDELSDGERATIMLYCILIDCIRTKRTLVLDEPENFVGLALIQPWLVELADAIREEGQLFVISHHPEVIDYLAADRSLLLERSNGGPTRVRIDPFDRDLGLKASELVGQGLLDAE
jgi:predicted ATPase